MLMTGEFIDPATPLDWGLFNRAVAADAVRGTTLKLCETLKAKPRGALATGNALVYRQLELGMDTAYADASATIACNFADDDAQEGVAAFWRNENRIGFNVEGFARRLIKIYKH